MPKHIIFLFLLLLYGQSMFSQVEVNIQVKQTTSRSAKLYIYAQTGTEVIDSAFRQSQGIFKFKLPTGFKQGVYKFALSKNIGFDLIVANEPRIDIETVVFAAEDSVKSVVSSENELFFQFQRIKKNYNQKCWFLKSLADFYPDSATFKKQIQVELVNAQRNYNLSIIRLAKSNESLLAASLIRLEIRPESEFGEQVENRISRFMEEWWKGAKLKDSRLANSPLLKSKLGGFIDLFVDESLTKEKQDSLFVEAAKTIMNLDASAEIKVFFREILMQTYINSDYNAVTKYLYETNFNGLSKLELTPEDLNTYQIQQKNGIGTEAFDFSFKMTDGTNLKLSKIQSPYKLIVFWSMWCPHCTDLMPDLLKTYQKYRASGLEVIAICIDEEIDGWKKFVIEKNFNWINTIETDNDENKVIKEYNVDGTPKILLIDKSLRVISRPSSVKQVEAKLKEILR